MAFWWMSSVGILGIAIGFVAQQLIRDFLAGIFITLEEDQYGIGDVIKTSAVVGTVESVGLRITRVRAEDGTIWYLRTEKYCASASAPRAATPRHRGRLTGRAASWHMLPESRTGGPHPGSTCGVQGAGDMRGLTLVYIGGCKVSFVS